MIAQLGERESEVFYRSVLEVGRSIRPRPTRCDLLLLRQEALGCLLRRLSVTFSRHEQGEWLMTARLGAGADQTYRSATIRSSSRSAAVLLFNWRWLCRPSPTAGLRLTSSIQRVLPPMVYPLARSYSLAPARRPAPAPRSDGLCPQRPGMIAQLGERESEVYQFLRSGVRSALVPALCALSCFEEA